MDGLNNTTYDSDGAEMQVEGSQDIITSSPPVIERPAKRRRVESSSSPTSHRSSYLSEDDYDLPSWEDQQGETDEQLAKKAKYLMHDPEYEDPIEAVFVTQLTQNVHSSPSRIRGPRWRKNLSSPTAPMRVVPESLPAYRPAPAKLPTESEPPLPRSIQDDLNDPDLQAAFFDDFDLAEFTAPTAPTQHDTGGRSRKPLQKAPSFRQQTLFGTQAQEATATQGRAHSWPLVHRDETPTHHKLDPEALKSWIYPTNLGKPRDYQFNIVQRGLYHNTLVALPTGLGKTFIAATIMLNWFRWTQDAQIVFVAPTKPLVHQQVEACFNIAGIPKSQTTMLTGEVPPAVRAEEWESKRVFFMTPQTLINDYKHGYADPKKLVLLVVDEAHRATGGYDYVKVVEFLGKFNYSFRVLALTATPGATVEAVQKVIDGLNIARVEIRTEQSLDIREYVYTRNLDIELFSNSEEIDLCIELFSKAVKPVLDKLSSQNAFWSKDPAVITVYGLNQSRAQWLKSEAGRNASFSVKGMIHSIFGVLMSLAHGLQLLKFHGIGPFYHKLKAFEDEQTKSKNALQIKGNEHFKKLMGTVKTWINNPTFIGHPKLLHLERVVLNHFLDAGEGTGRAGGRPPSETRIMVFAHYRDSAEEIVRVLNRHREMVRAKIFVGQSSAKGSDGMQQKMQLSAIQDFKSGVHNVLVATSVGEEGLDIGEVDLIICYDASASPIRMLQRMGRTGRKRTGNIEVLLMRGKEENDFNKSRDSYEKMQEIIARGKDFDFHFDKSPRIVPREIEPVVDRRIVEIPFENTQAAPIQPSRKARKPKPKKKFHMPDDVEDGFTTGAGKRISTKKSKVKTPVNKLKNSFAKLDQKHASLPSLDEVLLTTEEDEILGGTYAQVPGEEDQLIHPLRLHEPTTQRKPRAVVDVQHSSTTWNLVGAFNSMRKPNRMWTRPTERDLDPSVEGPICHHFDVAKTGAPKQRRRRQPLDRSSTVASSGADANEDEYDLNDDFVNDGELEIELKYDESDEDLEELTTSPKNRRPNAHQPHAFSYSATTAQEGEDDDDDDLPDFDTLVGRQSTIQSTTRASCGPKSKTRITKRVVDDDSDD